MEKKILDRRSMLGRLGGAGLASAFVLAKGGSMASAQTPGEIVVMVKGMVAAGQHCGEHFIANIEFTPDADGMIEDGIFQIAEMSADLPYMEIGEEYPFVGTYSGRTFDLRVEIKDELEDMLRYVSFHGVTEYVTGTEPLDEDGNKVVEVAGSFSGPIGCELGSWTTTITDDSEWCDGCGCCGETAAKVTTAAPVVPVVPGATTTECPTTTTTDAPTSTTTTTGEGTTTTTTTEDGTTTTTEEGTTTTTTTEDGTTTTTTTNPDCGPGGNWNGSSCVCLEGLIWSVDEGCVCPEQLILVNGVCEPPLECGMGSPVVSEDGTSQQCVCDDGYFLINGYCDGCGSNESYSEELGRCICVDNYGRPFPGGPCIVCDEDTEVVDDDRYCVITTPPPIICGSNEISGIEPICEDTCDGCFPVAPGQVCFCEPGYVRDSNGACILSNFCR